MSNQRRPITFNRPTEQWQLETERSYRNNCIDLLTVQVSDANSHLGQLLLEADWSEASDHLASPEGVRDADAANDPLGLFNSNSDGGKGETAHKIPRRKNSAFFAALFVRAPCDLIREIHGLAPQRIDLPEDLAYVLSVVPSEEEARLQQLNRTALHRTRTWTADEFSQILDLMVRSFYLSSESSPLSSSLLDVCPPWVVGAPGFQMTPLAIAAFNPDVPAAVLRHVCALEPRAMDRECNMFGTPTIPLVVAAASPVPPKLSSCYDDSKSRRWEKVKSLMQSREWYGEQRGLFPEKLRPGEDVADSKLPPTAESPPPAPSLRQVQLACEESMRRKEWELVRELLKHFSPESYSGEASAVAKKEKGGGDGDREVSESNAALESFRAALSRRDDEVRMASERRYQSEEKARAREEWLHRNMGFAMYHVNALVDLVSAVIPLRKRHDEDGSGLVSPMS
eukprot:CAMPEP_0172536624 /NCGR_PEP_ID=MMETSP1067-20121228/8359_1 /TAXON_ID=265564 ORGANISM="Thalassiosira punctigera, Strain Tpunct2005C2" /NCGR_SAMPLE_ID=MMETSP1067 /ASSEMBLY_ACC=CAM_ASM_000444 /LENGTH=454 /DNA_ID=CAMNT_0013321735 /DNA_START=245 /DNA_END=1609 /DNA_ORIENTATION=+